MTAYPFAPHVIEHFPRRRRWRGMAAVVLAAAAPLILIFAAWLA